MPNPVFSLRTFFFFAAPGLSQSCARTKTAIALLLFFLSLTHSPAQTADSLVPLPPAHWMPPQTLDVQHLALDLRFDWPKKQVLGTATLTLAPLQASASIDLDAGFLTILSIKTADGMPLRYRYEGGDHDNNLHITLDRRYAAGETLLLRIDYHSNYHNESDPNNLWGSYGKGVRFFEPSTTEPRRRRQIWSMGEPHGNRYWFPGHDAPADLHSTELRATVEAPLSVFSNGNLLSTQNNPDGTRTFHWKLDTPQANYQTAFVVGEYEDYVQPWDGVELHSLGYPDEMDAVRATTERLPDMARFFSEYTGRKYPYPTYRQVFVQEFPWGGGHNTGISTISENMIDDFGTHADFFYLWDGVESQDLAAQWFGNLLRPRDWEHAWLSKSFALYFADLYTEYKNGRDELLMWNRSFQHATYLADWTAGIRRPIVTRHYDTPETPTRDNYALRGALVLHLLRHELGDSLWQKAIRGYVGTYAGQLLSTEDFRRAVEAASGQPMDWFFDQWLYKMGHPVFEVTKTYDAARQQLSLRLRQTQQTDRNNAYPQAEFFQGKMDIEIDGRIEQVWLEPKADNVFNFGAATEPLLVQVDVGNSWIKEMRFDKSLAEHLYQFQHDRDILGRRAAMLELARLYKLETTSAADKTGIREAFRQVILGGGYWRLRYSAMLTLQGMVPAQPLDSALVSMLLSVIRNEGSWNRAAAIGFLGQTLDPQYAGLYIDHFKDPSDRVVNAAANALGKCKSPKAYAALVRLKDKPSWKNQSLISALNGLRELGDPRGAKLALAALADSPACARWTLATPVWDYRMAAAETLVALGKGAEGYPLVWERFKSAMAENNLNDLFSNALLAGTLGDPRSQELFQQLEQRFKDNPDALKALENIRGK